MSDEKNIPELTEVIGYAKDVEQNEFDFNGLIPGKALTEKDIENLNKQINTLIKSKIAAHSQLLYKDLAKNINLAIRNITNDNK